MVPRALPLILGLALAPVLPAAAQQPMSAQEFQSYVEGKTLYYSSGGIAYGVEEYLGGRRVRWSFLDGECKEGVWYEAGGRICFEYEDGTGPQCWSFFRGAGGLRARFAGDGPESELYETEQTDEPMQCKGPEIGV